MLILAVDTSGRSGGVALARGDANSLELIAAAPLTGGAYSAQLVPQIAALLAEQRLGVDQIDAFAVASGPGSFTGLRVGLAAVKALAEVGNKPVAAVSILEAIVAAAPVVASGSIFAALDAGRGEVYLAEYLVRGENRELLRELVARQSEFIAQIGAEGRDAPGPIATPDEAFAALAEASRLRALRVAMPGVAEVARLGLIKLLAGNTVSAADLDANYIRRSDAEILSSPANSTFTAETRRHGEE